MTLPNCLTDSMELQVHPASVRNARKLLNGKIEVLVEWANLPECEWSWEDMEELQELFPNFHLEDKVIVGGGGVVGPLKWVYERRKKQNKGKGHSDQPIALADSDKQPMTVNVQAMADSLGDQHQPIASSGGQGLVKQIVLAVEKKSTAREFVIKEHTWQALNGAYHVGGEWEKGISG
ncbi:uncharacterized protein LOC133308892 [Gastrolobium bilobum]|uniref:uncharacterized protein LOC133308892 n=1 Tax=Gastrolobium bilobum TaxID=150636 RepID=UPI002AB2C56B|nr:uncharacterized protein LOC133308892 [Gastrolobium bilobum]